MLYFRLFCKKFQNNAVNFSAFGRKTQLFRAFLERFDNFDEKSIENGIFIDFLENFVAKNRTFANNIILLQQFFSGSV